MSSSGGVGGFSSSSSDVDIKQGMAIVGMVLAFLVFLVILRFGCNICIDLAVLRDSDSLLRTLSEIRRCLFPWWHPRTQPQDLSSLSPTRNQGSNSHNTIDGREFELVNMDQLLMGLTPPQKQELVASMLTSKIASEEDINSWKNRSETQIPDGTAEERLETCSSSSNTHCILCPICINDIDIGSHVVSLSACEHIFHRDCLSQWLSTHTRDCPYCRTEIITQEMLEEAYRSRDNNSLISSGTEM